MPSHTIAIDIDNLPCPAGAPEPGSCVRVEREEDGALVRLRLDPPHRANPVFDAPLLRDLARALGDVERDPAVRGLIVCGREPLVFCYGADIDSISELESVEEATRIGRAGQEIFQRLHRLSRSGGGRVTTVAAVGGPVPGGACEVSLACDYIVLADDPRSRIGLPEVMLGILPGWGGCQRLPRRLGVPKALGAILTGKLYGARQAKKLGLVDRLAHPVYLDRIAADVATGRERLRRPERGYWTWLIDRNPAALAVIKSQARKGVMEQTKGHYPAPLRALEIAADAVRSPLQEGLQREAAALGQLALSPQSRALVRIFRTGEAVKRRAAGADGEKPARFTRAAVLGAGIMGGGIASLLAEKRIPTRLKDLAQHQLDEAQSAHEQRIAKKRKRRSLEAYQADAAIDRLELTREDLGFASCDFLIEAIAERLDVKRAVLGQFAEFVGPDTVIATNTSSLSVDAIADGLPHPERVIGMHFFNPVAKMPLVEVIRGAATSDAVVRRVVQLAIDLGKTPVVCADAPGFVVNRLLAPYLDEAMRLFESGSAPAELDRLALGFGLPMGPFTLLDEVGLDIGAHTVASLEAAFGERMAPSKVLEPLVAAGHLGKKSGRGIFLYGKGEDGDELNPALRRPASAPAVSSLSSEDRVDRMVLPMVNEAARILAEGVVESAAELDLATVYGMGFAPFRGGVLAYADARGLANVVERLRELAASPEVSKREGGRARFEPCEPLVELAALGGTFYGS
ncbi:3-hydroxyacyl-CoA dehydrogenase NAD-binding domain-containing protein [Engelhardtia mirabilis]|uniref:enoyl-CoA hydratase n=1 Tax=Engelhardtia mirabilis TaxID=2528011 RepID=A0A518BPS6_9BACT|nr:Fatty acid oxidation complex subunit alpha [Planctomycetes bacterium Pla133]QDV03292.1 Fatty acid oxidation complex subunit alpha [Planctomycetes bacterium Pla86]